MTNQVEKYLVAQVTADEHKEIKQRAVQQEISVKEWLCRAITLKMKHDDLIEKEQK